MYAYRPLSGAGAARNGGRFNRPGLKALYLARSPETALAEYLQGASIVSTPAILAAYKVSLNVVDLSDGYDPDHWSAEWAHWNCPWRDIANISHRVPESWILGDEIVRAGHAGLLFPSTRRLGDVNLVVYTDLITTLSEDQGVQVHDPRGYLPRDAASWSGPAQR
jgi:RES domain-containing protein